MAISIFNDTVSIIIIGLIFILTGMAAFLAIKANIRITVVEEKSRKPKSHNDNSTQSNAVNTEMFTKLTRRVDSLENKVLPGNAVLHQAYTPPAPAPVYEEKSPEINFTIDKPAAAPVFYMSTPNPDGSFEAAYKSDAFKGTVSLYKFTVDGQNSTRAKFEFSSDESGIKDALNNPKTYLEPVCHELNNPFYGAKKITTLEPGLAVKSGERWVVEKNNRAQIKYE